MKTRRKWLLWIFPAVMLLSLLACGVRCAQRIRQERLDQALIQAIKNQDATTAISLLNQGANANATNRPYKLLTWQSLWANFWNGLTGTKSPPDTTYYSPALTLVFGPVGFGFPDSSMGFMLNSDDFAPIDLSVKCQKASVPLISALLDHGACLDTKDHLGELLLAYACIRHDTETVRFLLERHVDPNARSFYGVGAFVLNGYPVLICATDGDCIRLLLDAGATVDARDPEGQTKLMCLEDPRQFPLLLAHGADPNAQDKAGQSALIHLVVSAYRDDAQIHTGMRFLLHSGAEVSLKDKKGKTALDYVRAGRANWLFGHGVGRYDKEGIHLLETALKRERTRKNTSHNTL